MKYFFALCVILLPLSAHAIFITNIELRLTPENPKPGERVVVSVHLRSGDSQLSAFRWFVDGVPTAQSIGEDSLAVDAPEAGGIKKVQVVVGSGDTAQAAQIIIRPADVSLVCEARTSTPPLFIGAPRAAADSTVVCSALPALTVGKDSLDSKSLVYEWKVNGKVLPKQGGVGVSTLVTKPPFYNDPFKVTVTVSTPDEAVVADRSIIIAPTTPSLVIYEETPLGGVYANNAITTQFPFGASEASFVAYPLAAINKEELRPAWTLNGKPFELEGDPWRAVFRKTAAGSGSYEVGVSFQHPKRFLENARLSFLLQF